MPFLLHFWFTVTLLLYHIAIASSNACTDACDEKYAQNLKKQFITICGTDGISHTFRHSRWGWGDPCYPKCGVMMKYAGRCGCPNECMAHVGHGTCVDSGEGSYECQCVPGWGGVDCSAIVCPYNTCSGHGRCVPYSVETSLPGELDRCHCDHNYTDYMCSTRSPHLSTQPYGNIYGDRPQYSAYDTYGDNHPVFNISAFFNIHVTLSPEDWVYLNDASTLYTQDWRPADFLFDNGVHRISVNQIGFRAKGAWTRADMKHGFAFSFTKYSKRRRFFGLRRMGLKGANENDIFVKDQMAMEFGKASCVPTQRTSFGMLWVNGLFMGLYWGHEDIDEVFALTRFGNAQGNLYKLAGVNMKYESPDPDFYRTATMPNPMTVVYRYEQNNGNGSLASWNDFVDLLKFLHNGITKDIKFQQALAQRIDINMFLRWCVIEAFMQDWDGIYGNNNYEWYLSDGKQWKYIRMDFDNSNLQNSRGILEWYGNKAPTNPLIRHVFALYNQTYLNMFGQFLTKTFGDQSPSPLPAEPVPVSRYRAYRDMLVNAYKLDFPWQTSTGMTEVEFYKNCNWNMQNVVKRYYTSQAQATVWMTAIPKWVTPTAVPFSRRGPYRPPSSTAAAGSGGGGIIPGGKQYSSTGSNVLNEEVDVNAAHMSSLKEGMVILAIVILILISTLILIPYCRRPSQQHQSQSRKQPHDPNNDSSASSGLLSSSLSVDSSSSSSSSSSTTFLNNNSEPAPIWPMSPILTQGVKVS